MTKPSKKTQKRAHPRPQNFGSGVAQDLTLVRATVHGDSGISTSAGGVIALAIQMDPNALSDTDWGDFSSTYDEFRVLGCRITLAPTQSNASAVNNTLACIAYDNDSHVTPASFSAVRQYSTSKVFNCIWQTQSKSFTWWRPVKGKETNIPWIDVAASSQSDGSIQLYAFGINASTQYFFYAVDLFCEFRGRR